MVRRRIRFSCTGVALRRHLPGEAEQVLHDLLGALRLLQDDTQDLCSAVAGSSGFSISRSAKPRIAVSGLFTSWATPETNCPTAAIFSAWTSLARNSAESVMSVITTTMLLMFPCSSRIGLRFTENWPACAVATHHLHFQIVDLSAVQNGLHARRPEDGRSRARPVPTRDAQQVPAAQSPRRTSGGWHS